MHPKSSEPVKHTPKHHDPNAETAAAQKAQTDAVNNPEYCQHPATSEMPSHLAAKTHAPYQVKPNVQHVNEQLSDATPTGYAAHDPAIDLDAAQLKSMEDDDPTGDKAYGNGSEVKNAKGEIKQRVENDKKDPTAHPAKAKP